MIKQRITITKTATDTLTVSEMGDIICNSSNAQIYTLPAASKGLWYRFHNINTGVVTISDGTDLAVLGQNEGCLAVNDGTDWYATSSVSSQEIPDSVDDLNPSQTGNAGKYLKTDGTNASWETVSGGGDYNIDGGVADSVYLPSQLIDGGDANG